MKMLYALVRNNEIVAKFPSKILADEAYTDLGCWVDDPAPEDVFEVLRLGDLYARQNEVSGSTTLTTTAGLGGVAMTESFAEWMKFGACPALAANGEKE